MDSVRGLDDLMGLVDKSQSLYGSPLAAPAQHPQQEEETAGGGSISNEVSNFIRMAKQQRVAKSNLPRAKKLIERAYHAAPHHPDVLAEYGAIEEAEGNMVKADGFFTKALHRDPNHQDALGGRNRVQREVERVDGQLLELVHAERKALQQIPVTDRQLRAKMACIYYDYVYHSLAIEGNQLSQPEVHSILKDGLAVGGKSLLENNEVLGLDRALQLLHKSFLPIQQIQLEHILAMHAEVMRFAEPDAAGRIRTDECRVGSHTPPAADELPNLLEQFITWLNSEETRNLDSVEMAAMAHYHLVTIHPFSDGNGRTCRLLMNLLLVQAGYPLVVVPVEKQDVYRAHLQDGNEGDTKAFVRFIAEMTLCALKELIGSSTWQPATPSRLAQSDPMKKTWSVRKMANIFMKSYP